MKSGGLIRRLLLALMALPVLWLAGLAWFVVQTTRPAPEAPSADAIVVLTGGKERVAAGLRLLLQGRAKLLLVSGVGRAVTLHDLATTAGLDASATASLAGRVTLGRNADTTHGNALETTDFVMQNGVSSLIVVTADYHMPRALAELRRQMPQTSLLPFPVHPQVGWRALIGEYGKFVAVALRAEDVAQTLGLGWAERAG